MILIEIILTLIKYFFMSGADLLQRTVLNVVSASDIVLGSSAGGPGFNPQSRTVSYQRRYKPNDHAQPTKVER